ncbi:uncharacterized protein LOC117171465 isoform X2 [Belonocnema kinseyi]|uniref:uncharacterized protein LOC117171465 isoform X2 n=1 Tax=Belonocnema kinseyi TaxID=2817044 RepID=UPI00143DF8C4|nr:uncharacterized protein LOC117171465 isoform X2 [Belonocnema kinseyi]
MPFVIRKIEPRYVSRGHVPQGKASQDWPVGAELEAVANGALTASLKQLASLLTAAEDIFADLTAELTTVADRSGKLRQRLDKVEEHLSNTDPKKIPVPESDMSTFALRTEHFKSWNKPVTSLFTSDTRPKALKELYEAAAIVAVKTLDSLRRDQDGSSMDMFLCTPVLGKRRRDQSLDIESRVPAAIEDLRRWTSTEALGDVTVPPDCMSRILGDTTDDSAVDHKLPSPEEQVQAVALKFPAEIVAVDVSGRGFYRMSMRRRSLLSGPERQETAVKRRSRPRRPRGKRRNTIAGTDQKEIRQAIEGETTVDEPDDIAGPSRAHRSASTDILGSSKKHSPLEKKSHFNTLKAWGISRLKLISPKNSQSAQQLQQPEADTGSVSPERTAEGQTTLPEENNIYETVTTRRRKDKSHERKPSSSSSSGKSTSSIPVSVPSSDKQLSVKLRESAAQRRERRKGSGRDDAPHSSSGNWSASSESGRASIGSETTTTTHQPRFKGRDTSASSSVTSEGTLTPDIIHDIGPVPFSDDGETSSVYSCDTEGYYTSFHMDSGLKTLREEEILPQSPLVRSCNLDSDPTSPVVENEYELFGRGSTSTTTSSAGTVCTALLAPPPPERKSSLTVVAMVHGQNKPGGESPDSGHNTSSSPVESASSPACTGRSYSEFEYSESSDLEGCDRIERIRSKTAINTSRIPSMCVITPPGSDDEHAKDRDKNKQGNNESPGSVLMSATVGTSKMEVINGQDKNLYATVQTVLPPPEQKAPVQSSVSTKLSPLSGVLGKLRGVLPLTGKKHQQKTNIQESVNPDSGDYVTIADVRNNNDKLPDSTLTIRSAVTYANADLFKKDAEYVSLSELPKKPDSSLERKRQGARVTLDSEGKVVYSSDSLRRRKGAHTTFNPGPFVKEGVSPSPSPLLHRAHVNVRAVNRATDSVDGKPKSSPPTSPQLGKVIIRAAKSPDRAASPDYVRTPSTVVSPTCPTSPHKQVRGAYVNVQGDEDNTVLPIAGDSIPVQMTVQQPPPYIGPPQPHDMRKAQSYEDFANDSKAQTLFYSQQCPKRMYDNRANYYQKQQAVVYHQQTYIEDPRNYQVYDQNSQYFDQQQIPQNYAENQMLYNQRVVQAQNARNQQFFTLPNRRSQRDNEPPRSVTPDITRGLGRGPVSSMHMLARQSQNPGMEQMGYHGQMESDSHMDLNRRHVELEARSRIMQQQQQQQQQQRNLPVDVKNRFAAPQGLSALGYRFFASSPVQPLDRRSPSNESLKRTPISPIGPEHNNGFKSSTPTARSTPTVAERLALTTKVPSTKVSTSGRSTPVSGSSSGRNTPTNFVISPTRSTMSNEELFAAIHKSKKRLNIKEDSENLSPSGSMNSLVKNNAGTRHSWSPESQKVPEIPPTIQVPSTTSRLDFKRLLLQQSVKTGPTRLSAAEQLKLSRQQCQLQQSPQSSPLSPLSKVLSPRSAWRFQTPRTDVLSSTIIEDTAAEEKAMKPSPENTMPSAKSRRQLDLCKQKDNQEVQNENRFSTKLIKELNNASDMRTQNPQTNLEATSENRTEFRTDNRVAVPKVSEERVPPLHSQGTMLNLREEVKDSCPKTSAQTRSSQDPISAFESRRLSNQLAKAQFLASGVPVGQNQNQNPVLQKRFRARSESPQHAIAQNVSRSPSAPTLETAL